MWKTRCMWKDNEYNSLPLIQKTMKITGKVKNER